MNGYAGKILRVDLSNKKIKIEKLSSNLVRNYIGGTGFCARIMYDELPASINPLGEENKLILATGPLTGTFWTSAGRFVVCGKSPLTNGWCESNVGGFFGPELKYAGYDMLIIEGKASKPSYLTINDDEISIENASQLWGKGTSHTIDFLKGRYKGEVMAIGQAGENLVKFACIITNYSNAAGRGGLGAVLGSKKLKAVVVRGTNTFSVAELEKFYKLVEKARHRLMNNPQNRELSKYGTNLLVAYKSQIGELVTKNHQTGVFKASNKINADTLRNKYYIKSRACFSCPTGCKKVYKIKSGEYKNVISGGPEYEGTMALGSNCLNANFGSISKGNKLCNELGLDVISTGKVISYLMECSEHSLLSRNAELSWGNHKAIIKLIPKIAFRNGIGDLLAEGVKRAAEKIGGKEFAMHVKGMEISGQDGRAHRSAALTHAISSRGADHLRSLVTVDQLGYKEAAAQRFGSDKLPEICEPYTEKYKALAVKVTEDAFAIRDSLITCWYTCGWPPVFWVEDFAELLPPATGIKEFGSVENLFKIGERICLLRKLFNLREGIIKDTLPKRFMQPLPDGPAKDQVVNLKIMLDEYYKLRHWDERGIPTPIEAERLGLKRELELALKK